MNILEGIGEVLKISEVTSVIVSVTCVLTTGLIYVFQGKFYYFNYFPTSSFLWVQMSDNMKKFYSIPTVLIICFSYITFSFLVYLIEQDGYNNLI